MVHKNKIVNEVKHELMSLQGRSSHGTAYLVHNVGCRVALLCLIFLLCVTSPRQFFSTAPSPSKLPFSDHPWAGNVRDNLYCCSIHRNQALPSQVEGTAVDYIKRYQEVSRTMHSRRVFCHRYHSAEPWTQYPPHISSQCLGGSSAMDSLDNSSLHHVMLHMIRGWS